MEGAGKAVVINDKLNFLHVGVTAGGRTQHKCVCSAKFLFVFAHGRM